MLKLENVRAGYDGAEVLHGVSACFRDGENYVLLGANGCGKTTLLRAIAHLIPYSGSIAIDGGEVSAMKRGELAERLAVMSQINEIYFSYTVYDTVMLGRYPHMKRQRRSYANEQDRAAVERCLRSTELWEMRDRPIDALSGGQRQRVFLAHTLAQEPERILLDEPTNHLDVRHQLELIDYLKQWSADGKHSVIGVFHDINLALRLSENVLFMKDGRIVRGGRFDEIADRDLLNDVYGMDIAGYMRQIGRRWETR